MRSVCLLRFCVVPLCCVFIFALCYCVVFLRCVFALCFCVFAFSCCVLVLCGGPRPPPHRVLLKKNSPAECNYEIYDKEPLAIDNTHPDSPNPRLPTLAHVAVTLPRTAEIQTVSSKSRGEPNLRLLADNPPPPQRNSPLLYHKIFKLLLTKPPRPLRWTLPTRLHR